MVDTTVHESLWRKWSIGIAAANKPLSTSEVEIWPSEVLPYVDGEINTNRDRIDHKGVDAEGKEYQCTVESSNTVLCKWYPQGDNRVSAPDIRRGERVQIWRYADTDEYWWSSLGLDGHLRRLETVQHAYSATKDEATKELTPANSYYHEVSTHKKTITGGTSKANGEPFAYTYQINAAEGNWQIADDDGNSVSLDSAAREFLITNKDGCSLHMVKADMTVTVPGKFLLKANSATFTIAKALMITAASASLDITGQLLLKGATLVMQGAATLTGTGFNVNAAVTFAQAAVFNAAITHLSKNIGSTHTHSDVQSGSSNTGAVN